MHLLRPYFTLSAQLLDWQQQRMTSWRGIPRNCLKLFPVPSFFILILCWNLILSTEHNSKHDPSIVHLTWALRLSFLPVRVICEGKCLIEASWCLKVSQGENDTPRPRWLLLFSCGRLSFLRTLLLPWLTCGAHKWRRRIIRIRTGRTSHCQTEPRHAEIKVLQAVKEFALILINLHSRFLCVRPNYSCIVPSSSSSSVPWPLFERRDGVGTLFYYVGKLCTSFACPEQLDTYFDEEEDDGDEAAAATVSVKLKGDGQGD